MHELSVAIEICRIAESQVGVGEAATITRVGIVVGDDSGLEPANLSFCLETLLSQPPFKNAKPELIPGRGDVLRVDYLEVDDARASD